LSELDQARSSVQLPYRWMRPPTIVAIVFVVTTAFQTQPEPGAHGHSLGVVVVASSDAMSTTVDTSRTSGNQTKHARSLRHS